MIVREEKDRFVLTAQYDHGQVSGQIAQAFAHFFKGDEQFCDVLFAISDHDRSWFLPDTIPSWNSENQRPIDFIDYPLHPKLEYYSLGLDQTEQFNPYAALLCSKHYCSFIDDETEDPLSRKFLEAEQIRQERIWNDLKRSNPSLLLNHFRLLQLCDNLSLYLYLNRPGASKEEEHIFFKNGFKNSYCFNPQNDRDLIAGWKNEREVSLSPNPFDGSFEVSIIQKHVKKKNIEKIGIEKAYLNSDRVPMTVRFI